MCEQSKLTRNIVCNEKVEKEKKRNNTLILIFNSKFDQLHFIFAMTIIVYITSVTFKKELHTQQGHIETVLKAKQLPYQLIDIAQDTSKKDEMRLKCGNETAVAPQIFNEDFYCGDYKTFQQAVEEDRVLSFLKVV